MATNISCLESIVRGGLLPKLLNTFAAISVANKILYKKIDPFEKFLVAHRHVLLKHSTLTLQCAINMPGDSAIHKAARGIATPDSAFVGWRNREFHGEKECIETDMITNEGILCVAFDDKGDLLALGGRDWICRIVKQVDGTIPHKLRHPSDVTAVVFCNRYVITGCEDGLVRVWSLFDGSIVQQARGHTRRINDFALHPTRSSVLSACDDATARLWSLQGGQRDLRYLKVFRYHKGPVSCAAIHSSGNVYATGSWDGRVCFWGVDKEAKDVWFNAKSGAVRSIAFIPSMVVTLAVATYDGRVHLYDYAATQVSMVFDQHLARPISRIGFSPDAKKMLTSDASGVLKVWRAGVVGTVMGSLNGHSKGINGATFHPVKADVLVTASTDATARHWIAPEENEHLGAVHGSNVLCSAFSPNGKFYVTGSRDRTAKFVEVNEDANYRVTFTMTHPAAVGAVAITPANDRIITGCHDGIVRLWRAEPGLAGNDGSMLAELAAHSTPVRSIVLSETGIFSVGFGFECAKLDLRTNTIVKKASSSDVGEPYSASMYRDSLLVFHSKGCATIRDFGGMNQVPRNLRVDKTGKVWILAAATSHDGSTLVCGSSAGQLQVTQLDADSGAEMFTSRDLFDDLKPGKQSTTIRAISFFGNSSYRFAVACGDYTVRVFTILLGRLKMDHIFHGTSPITTVGASAHHLVAGDELGNVYLLHPHDSRHMQQQRQQAAAATGGTEATGSSEAWDDDAASSMGESLLQADSLEADDDDLMPWSDSTIDARTAGTSTQRGAAPAAPPVDQFARFSILSEQVPFDCKGQDRKAWYIRQRETLKIAMKEQKTNPAARFALRGYAKRAASMYGVFHKLQDAQL